MGLNVEKQKFVISADSTIEEAWTVIEANRQRSVIVVDGTKVVGTLSDGDLRKAILSRRLLNTPVSEVMNINFISLLKEEKLRASSIFHDKKIFLIPVVDRKMHLIDIIVE